MTSRKRLLFGRTQIQNILKRKLEIKSGFKSSQPSSKKRRLRITDSEDINKLTWEWFKDAVARSLLVTGLMPQEQAVLLAEQLNVQTFQGSNWWYGSFRKQYKTSFARQFLESADVSRATVDKRIEKLPTLILSCDPKDIYNMDKTDIFLEPVMTELCFKFC